MKFFLVTILGILCHNVLAVRDCYKCEGDVCKKEPIPQVNCFEEFKNPNGSYLCQITKNYTGSEYTSTRSCIENNSDKINICDLMNRADGYYCLHCDRELCNTSGTIPIFFINTGTLFISLALLMIFKQF